MNGETILLVEDEPAVRQLFAQALVRAGYHVHEARNGQEAMNSSSSMATASTCC